MRATTCNYLVDLNPKFDRIRTLWERERARLQSQNGRSRTAMEEADKKFLDTVEPILVRDVKEGRAFCKADFDAPFQETLSLDQIAETFGITRPRVQQIEARARKKIEREKENLKDFVIESGPDEK